MTTPKHGPIAPPAARNGSTKPPSVRVVLADDHVLVRQVLAAALLGEGDAYRIVGEAATAAEAIGLCQKLKPDLLILDCKLPGPSGVDALPAIKRHAPSTRILLCSGTPTESDLLAAIRAGVDGFVEKTSDSLEFRCAVVRVGRGELYLGPRASRLLSELACALHPAAPNGDARLSPREKEIRALIAAGRTSKEIADTLHLSIATVDTHRRNMMAKLGAHNVADLIRNSYQGGPIPRSAPAPQRRK